LARVEPLRHKADDRQLGRLTTLPAELAGDGQPHVPDLADNEGLGPCVLQGGDILVLVDVAVGEQDARGGGAGDRPSR
jgi:hypothetical protein